MNPTFKKLLPQFCGSTLLTLEEQTVFDQVMEIFLHVQTANGISICSLIYP